MLNLCTNRINEEITEKTGLTIDLIVSTFTDHNLSKHASSQCKYWTNNSNDWIIFQSYSTLAGAYNRKTGEVISAKGYSVTTSKQFTFFLREVA